MINNQTVEPNSWTKQLNQTVEPNSWTKQQTSEPCNYSNQTVDRVKAVETNVQLNQTVEPQSLGDNLYVCEEWPSLVCGDFVYTYLLSHIEALKFNIWKMYT